MSLWDKTKEFTNKKWQDVYNTAVGPRTESEFIEKGVLTPEEFVKAGDLLVYKCPTWKWQSGEKTVSYLPPDKQFLITKRVPCLMRATALERAVNDSKTQDILIDGDEGWVETHVGHQKHDDTEEIEEIPTNEPTSSSSSTSAAVPTASSSATVEDDDDEPVDLETFDDDNNIVEPEDQGALQKPSSSSSSGSTSGSTDSSDDTIVRTRTYDIILTYDQYYQTPKVWLFGYNEAGQVLKPEDVFADISQDHAQKTVTFDTHPHLQIPCAYIHPCKHANVMNKILQRQLEAGKVPRVDQYLFLFLKFLSAVIPTIEYDYTVEFDV